MSAETVNVEHSSILEVMRILIHDDLEEVVVIFTPASSRRPKREQKQTKIKNDKNDNNKKPPCSRLGIETRTLYDRLQLHLVDQVNLYKSSKP